MTRPIEIDAPDGSVVEFPAGTPNETIVRAMRERFGGPRESSDLGATAAITAAGAVKGGRDAANLLKLLQGLASLGGPAARILNPGYGGDAPEKIAEWAGRNAPLTDPLAASRVMSPLPYRAYEQITGDVVGDTPEATAAKRGAEMTPLRRGLAAGAEIGAGALPYVATGPVGMGLKLAGASAALGGLGEMYGGETGKVAGALAPALLAPIGALRRGVKPPTTAALKNQASALYKRSGAEDVIIGAPAIESGVDRIKKFLADQAYHPAAHPNTATGLKILEESAGNNMTLKGSEMLRDIVRDLGGQAKRAGNFKDARLVKAMVREWDDSTRGLTNKDVLQGNVEKAVADYRQADSIWGRAKRAESVEKVIETAGTRAASPDLALRNEFATLVRQLNKRGWHGFSGTERKAVEGMVEPHGMRRIIRALGYLPLFAPGYGEAGKALAGRMASGKANKVAELLRGGSSVRERLARALGATPSVVTPRLTEQ